MNLATVLLVAGVVALFVTIAAILFAVPVAVMHRGGRQPSGLQVGLVGIAAALATVMLGGVLLNGGAAHATTKPTPYVLVAWKITNPESIWEVPQEYVTSVLLEKPTLDALDNALPCGLHTQIDLYWANNDSAALIAGRLLYGPNNPTEPLAYGAVRGNPWKYLTTEPCAPKPELRPYFDEQTTHDCEFTTTVTREGVYEVDFDPYANVWTERAEPTITSESSSKAPVSDVDKDEACAPDEQIPTLAKTEDRLADTGLTPAASWLLIGALGAVIAGLMLALYRRSREAQQ